jgi:hypothetical protein
MQVGGLSNNLDMLSQYISTQLTTNHTNSTNYAGKKFWNIYVGFLENIST